jgi:hypothetical protein
MKNKYVKRSKISEAKFRSMIMYFCLELDSQKIAALTSLNRNTVSRYLGRVRSRIVDLCENQARLKQPDLEKRPLQYDGGPAFEYVKPSTESLPVFGIRSRNDHIHTKLLSNGIHRKLRRFSSKGEAESIGNLPKEWLVYDGIVDLNGRRHYRLSPLLPQNAKGRAMADGIEAFLAFARRRLTMFNLNGDDRFYLDLKECEFRFNNRSEDLYRLLLKQFREHPLV